MPGHVVVIGAGVIGLTCALTLARRGAGVTLLSDGRPGATAAAAGMLCPSFEALHHGGPALYEMGTRSLALWDAFAASLTDDPAGALGYRRDGAVGVGFPPGTLDGEPAPVPDGIEATGAVLVPGEGRVDPRRLLAALDAACEGAGVTRVQGEVATLTAGPDGVIVRTNEGEAVTARRVVVAGGAGPLAASLAGGRLDPIRGRAFRVADVPAPARIVRSPSVYLCPDPDGTLYVGATEEERDMPSAPGALWSEACWLMPALRGGRIVGHYDGVRPGTTNGLPIVRRCEGIEGVTLALGHHRNGVLLAPLTAERVAASTL